MDKFMSDKIAFLDLPQGFQSLPPTPIMLKFTFRKKIRVNQATVKYGRVPRVSEK